MYKKEKKKKTKKKMTSNAQLSNYDLLDAARRFNILLNGVYSKNELPRIPPMGGYIINMENTHDSAGNPLGGSHWVAVWIERKGFCAYFDPFGFPPPIEIENWLGRKTLYINNIMIQSIASEICGYYCIYFIYYMNRYKNVFPNLKNRLKEFIYQFDTNNHKKNRQILQEEFQKHFPKK